MAGFLKLKGIVLAGLMRAQKRICVSDGEGGMDPQFHVMTPEGDFWISMPLADDPLECMRDLHKVSKFMAWKRATVFTVAGELTNPDAVYCFGGSHTDRIAALSTIERRPNRFSAPEWLPPEQVADEVLDLLPRSEVALDAAELDVYFGAHGRFPAVRLGVSS
ncbi:MAG: hypothetical protein ACLPWS_21195 [Rhodomicrobium sp.]